MPDAIYFGYLGNQKTQTRCLIVYCALMSRYGRAVGRIVHRVCIQVAESSECGFESDRDLVDCVLEQDTLP